MDAVAASVPTRNPRRFVPEDLAVSTWETIEPWYHKLLDRPIESLADLENWLRDRSELDAMVEESFGWKHINSTRDTASEQNRKELNDFISGIQPRLSPVANALDRKLISSPFAGQLDAERYTIYLRSAKKNVAIYREESIPLITEMELREQDYYEVTGAMTVTIRGKEMTLQQAANCLKETDRDIRREAFAAIRDRRLADREKLDGLFSGLVALRHRIAVQAGYGNYRDYAFDALGRFDYTVQDCLDFHDAVAGEFVPLADALNERRRERMGLDALKPWDTDVDEDGLPPLKPFANGEELTEKTIRCFQAIRPQFGEFMETMRAMGHLDLESRKGKAPGGYNCSLEEIGVPFIFMNSVGSLRDLETMVHEGGHAIHSFLTRDLQPIYLRNYPSEVAELASMAMELISMEHWADHFLPAEQDYRRACRFQLEGIVRMFPWVAAVDCFQQWIYTNPGHLPEERKKAWSDIMQRFGSRSVDWEGEEEYYAYLWQKQLHIFTNPFYYIEYGIAQLGALGIWKNYRSDREKALQAYTDALKLGYTRAIGDIYKTAGVPFDLSGPHILELAALLRSELL